MDRSWERNIVVREQISFFDKPKIKLLEDWTRLHPLLTKNSVWEMKEGQMSAFDFVEDIKREEELELLKSNRL